MTIYKRKFLQEKLTILLLLFVALTVISQSTLKDSLTYRIDSEKNIESKLSAYSNFFDKVESDSIRNLREHLNSYLNLSQIAQNQSSIANAMYHYLRYYREVDELDHALLYGDSMSVFLIEQSDFIEEKTRRILEIKYLNIKTLILDAKSRNEDAVELNYEISNKIQELAKAFPKTNVDKFRYSNYMAFGNHYLFENDSLSYDYIKQAEQVARKLGNESFLLTSLNSSYYANYFGNNGILLNNIADSCIYYAKRLDDVERLGEGYMHKCNALVVLNKADDAEIYCELAISTFSQLNDPIYLSSVMNNIANVFEKTDDPSRSLKYYERSFELARNIENGSGYLTPLNNLAEKYLNLSRYQESAEHYKIYADSQQVYYENLISSRFTEAEAKYQTGQKEVEIAEQKVKIAEEKSLRNRIIWIGSLLLLLGLGLFQWYRSRQKREQIKAELELAGQRREAKQLKELDKMKTQFFTNVSHELRTPLTLISGPLENILTSNKRKDIDQDLQLAHSNSKKLLTLINEILDLAKMESGKMKLNLTAAHIHPLLNRLVYAFSSFAETKKVLLTLNNRTSEELFIKIDIDKLETILNNLISNAIKFSGPGEAVMVEASIYQNRLLLSVSDEGTGIQKGDELKIFERFYQSKQNSNLMSGGTGVGLALCKEIIDLMGGTIEAENNSKVGATFSLEIPIKVTDRNEVHETAEVISESLHTYVPLLINGEKPRILIVEDNKEMSDYIASILSPHYECSFAYDGYECLQKVQKEQFDVISSDVMMPRMDGFTLKQKINELDRSKSLPFIFLTAKSLDEDKLFGLNLGVDDYISKPFNKNEYLTRIHNLLQNKKVRDEAISGFVDEDEISDSVDRKSLKQAEKIVLDNLQNLEFKIQDLANGMNYSQRQLTRIIKKLTGLTPVNFILEIRLQKAYQFLNQRKFSTISEVRYEVGIESASYFTKKFAERFGLLPKEMLD